MRWSLSVLLVLLFGLAGPFLGQEAPLEEDELAESVANDGEEAFDPPPTRSPERVGDVLSGAPSDAITFVLPLPEDQGGGEVHGEAGAMEYRLENFVVLTGGVEIRYQDVIIRADEIQFDLSTQDLVAEGNVIIDQGPDRFTAQQAEMNLETKTGTFLNATVASATGYYFEGEEVIRESETVYRIKDGIFTSCEGEVPPWSFRVREARIEEDAYVRLRRTSMRVKQVPVLYIPYLLWPTTTDRSSGLLLPKIGSSNDKGSYFGLAYFQVLGRSYDTTIFTDVWSKGFYGIGNEFRYRPSENTEGTFEGYTLWDPESEEWRWKVRLDHDTSSLPLGLRATVHLEEYSDFEWFRDFERDLSAKARPWFYSTAFLTGTWGPHLATLLLDSRKNFSTSSGRPIVLRQLPELEYIMRPVKLKRTPLYMSIDAAANYFDVDRSDSYQGNYGRLDLAPEIKYPLSSWPWLAASIAGGYRYTWYGDSIASLDGQTGFTGQSLSRSVPTASAEIIGPSFSRIFNKGIGSFGKLKHIVEPRFDYSFQQAFDDQSSIPVFDERDTIAGRNFGRLALINRVMGKPRDDSEEERDAMSSIPDGTVLADLPAGVRAVEGEIVAPRRLESPAPSYPEELEAGIQGVVVLQVVIDEQGLVTDAAVLSGVEPALDEAAVEAVRRWTFEPATLDGEPVAVYENLTVRFGSNSGAARGGSAREILSVELFRNYSFDADRPLETDAEGETSPWGPLGLTVRSYPSNRFGLRIDASYSVFNSQTTAVRITGDVGGARNRVSLSWAPTWRSTTGEKLSDQIVVGGRWQILPGRLHLTSGVSYDIENALLVDQRHFLSWLGSCFTVKFEYHESSASTQTRRDFLFSIDLKNVGTFLDLTGGQSAGF